MKQQQLDLVEALIFSVKVTTNQPEKLARLLWRKDVTS